MTYTSNQALISKIAQKVNEDLSSAARTHVATYLGTADSASDRETFCAALKSDIAVFTGVNAAIKVTYAINELSTACQLASLDSSTGDATFYHSGDGYSHTFYTCSGGTATLLYTATADLASFEAARGACYRWVNSNPTEDHMGSYTNDCTGALPLGALALSTCLEGMDHPIA